MAVLENNIMAVSTQVIDPPKETYTIYPTKDAYIDQENPVFSFGTTADLLIKSSSTKEDKAILSFIIPDFNEEGIDYNSIINAKLWFSLAEYLWRDTKFILKTIEDDGWSETGTTWAGQPIEYQTIKTVDVKAGTYKFVFDIYDLIIAAKGMRTVFAFSLSEDNGEQENYIHICAREKSVSSLRPQIICEYEYFPDNYDIADLKADLTVRKNKTAGLPSNLTVIGGVKNADIQGALTVKGYNNSYDGITASMYTAANGSAELQSDLTVQRYSKSDLPANDFKIKLYNTYKDLIVDNFNVIQYYGDIPVSMAIQKFHATEDLPVIFAIKKDAQKELTAFAIIKGHKNRSELKADMTVIKHVNKIPEKGLPDIFNPDIPVSPDNPAYNPDSPDYISPSVRRLIKESSLKADITIPLHNNNAELATNIIVRPNGICEVSVSDFSVKGYHEDQDAILAKLKVKPHADIVTDNFYVLKTSKAELEASMITRPSWAHDLPATMRTVKDPRKPYAFIM